MHLGAKVSGVEFTGSKVALFNDGKLVVFLRDDNPGITNPGKWDFFGGGREGSESPTECAIREIEEETGIRISSDRLTGERMYPSLHDPDLAAYFYVATVTSEEVACLKLTEGQRWELMDVEDFLTREDAVEGMKTRLRDYLELSS